MRSARYSRVSRCSVKMMIFRAASGAGACSAGDRGVHGGQDVLAGDGALAGEVVAEPGEHAVGVGEGGAGRRRVGRGPGRRGEHGVGQDAAQLGPLLVGAEAADPAGEVGEVGEDRQFLVELGDGAGRGGGVGDLGLGVLGLTAGQVVAVAAEVVQVGLGGVLAEQVAEPGGQVLVLAAEVAVAQLVPALLQALVPPFQRLQDRLGTGGEPALQHGEREADGGAALEVARLLELVGVGHLLADVLGDRLVQLLLGVGQLVGDGVGAALGEQRPAVEGLQVFLDHAAHQPVGVHRVHRVPVPALEPVGVQQRQEQLEVLVPSRVRGRGHQQQVPGVPAEQLAELVALGLLQLVAEVVRRHPVRLVHDYQVPVGPIQLVLEVVGTRQLVHPGDQQLVLGENGVLGGWRLGVGELPGEQLEVQPELVAQLILPLLHQAAGRDDQAAFQVAAEHQLLDVQARHDRLARARVVGEQEPQRRPAEQLAVDGLDLVRERLQVGGVHREHRVEPAGHPDPQRLGGQLERRGVRGEVVGGASLGQFQAWLVIAVQETLVEPASVRAVGEAEGVAADPGHRHHRHRRTTSYPENLRASSNVFEPHHVPSSPVTTLRAGTDKK